MCREIRVAAVLLLGVLLLWTGAAGAAGPLFLGGDDADDTGHCRGTACGGLYAKALKTVYDKSTGPGTGILAIGVNGSTSSTARSALIGWNNVLNGGPGAPITIVTSTTAISTVNFSLYRMIYVPSGSNNTSNGITSTQLAALNGRQAAIQTFVNNGGGVLALTEQGLTGAYAWFPVPVPLTFSAINDTNIDVTGLGITGDMSAFAVGPNNANMDHCCYHTMWTGVTGAAGIFGALKVLAVTRQHNLPSTTTPGPVILG